MQLALQPRVPATNPPGTVLQSQPSRAAPSHSSPSSTTPFPQFSGYDLSSLSNQALPWDDLETDFWFDVDAQSIPRFYVPKAWVRILEDDGSITLSPRVALLVAGGGERRVTQNLKQSCWKPHVRRHRAGASVQTLRTFRFRLLTLDQFSILSAP